MRQKKIPESKDPLHRLWNALTYPPYKALPWAMFFYAVLSCLVYIDNGPFTGHIIGFDDQARMTQVLQWVNGGGWYDRLITRVNAPEGFQSIWARIVDIPIAFVIVIAEQFTDQKTAALAASVVVPMIELALMFLAARYFARPIAGKKEARLVVLFLMFTTVLNHKIYTLAGFHLGEASHHAWYGILNVAMFGAAARIVLGVAGYAPKIMLGGAIALLLAVGVEGLPMIAGVVAILSLLSWGFGTPHLARRGAEALGIGSLLSLLLLPMHAPPEQWLDVSFAQPSILGPLVTAIAAAFLLLQSLIVRNIKQRLVTGILLMSLAMAVATALIVAFPDILAGGTASLSPNERKLAATEHPEVWSMFRVAADTIDYIGLVMPSVIALIAGLAAMITTGNTRRRMMYGAYAGFAAVPSGLAQIYWRYIHHAQTAVCPLLLYAWRKIRVAAPKNTSYALLSFLAFIALGPFWMVFLPALDMNAPFLTQVAFFPAKIYTEPYSCDTLSFADYLNKHYGPKTLINVPDWDSASFLYETDLRIDFLSNYPSHDHFIDNKQFFQTQDVALARQIAARHGFDLVAVCVFIPMSPDMVASRPYRMPSMIERLKEGSPPPWLKPVPVTGVRTNYRLFEIDRTELPKGQ
jgi:hypothetical protein